MSDIDFSKAFEDINNIIDQNRYLTDGVNRFIHRPIKEGYFLSCAEICINRNITYELAIINPDGSVNEPILSESCTRNEILSYARIIGNFLQRSSNIRDSIDYLIDSEIRLNDNINILQEQSKSDDYRLLLAHVLIEDESYYRVVLHNIIHDTDKEYNYESSFQALHKYEELYNTCILNLLSKPDLTEFEEEEIINDDNLINGFNIIMVD